MKLKNTKGSVLVAVLWSLFFLAALAVVINISITPQLVLAARLRDRVMLRHLARAGVQRAIVEIREDETQEIDTLNEPWIFNEEAFKEVSLNDQGYFSLEYAYSTGGDFSDGVRYGLVDEERKINVNGAPADILKVFFEVVAQTSSQDATDIADAIIDWRDEDNEPSDNGAESSYYQGLKDGYACKNAPFEVVEELTLVKGITPEIFDKIRHRVTVYGNGRVNINTADALVLEGLGLSSDLVEKIIWYRSGNDGREGTEDDIAFEHPNDVITAVGSARGVAPEDAEYFEEIMETGIIGVRSDNFRGSSVGRFHDGSQFAQIVFVVDRDDHIRYWKEY